jgi:hypothetical protein
MPTVRPARFARILLAVAALSVTFVAGYAAQPQNEPTRQRIRLSRERQIALAISTAPAQISEHATIYVLESRGYVKVKDGTNGFSCLVEHQLLETYEPVCYDPEGSATLLHARFLREELRAQGLDETQVAARITQAFKEGKLKAPRKPGFVYMMAKDQRVLLPTTNKIVDGGEPHLMLYAPYATNKEYGGSPAIIFEGQPDAFIVAPTGVHATGHKR